VAEISGADICVGAWVVKPDLYKRKPPVHRPGAFEINFSDCIYTTPFSSLFIRVASLAF
jgi:hypothetical protein